jgi:hypothetical protein
MAQRKDTAANWTSANPILLSGEIGYETDTKKFKIGNGSSNWNSLAYLPIPDGSGNLTITGNLEIGSTGSLTFEGSTADAFETTLAVTNPTADRTITLPDRSGTVITSGDTGTVTSTMLADGTIVNADISATAAIAGSKLQAATTSNAGAVQLTDSTGSTSTTTAATPNSVKSAYDLANAALPKAGGTVTGDVTLNAQSDLRFADSDSSNWVAFQGPATVASNVTWTLPSADGTSGQVLSTNGSGTLSWSTSGGTSITQGNTTAEVIDTGSDGRFVVTTEGSERLRVTAAGLVGVGTTAFPASTPIQVKAVGAGSGGYAIVSANDENAGGVILNASSENSIRIEADPGNLRGSSYINLSVDGTERARIDSSGRVLIGKTTDSDIQGFSTGTYMYQVTDGGVCAYFNRLTSDGTLIQFRQDTVDEGSISVSGTTVSYNGAHLSRWSQLPSGQDRTEILRGSVLSNIDEMCEWGEEDNEQLNRMKVSDVEGDKNVSGVFQAWDDDDDTYTNDFYCAMTGDFIIRISAGIPVHRGQLLMSAGDGTAKPQDDDIVRSKTIAKVTSNHITCTYDDGSYCVPCVLMAC